MKELTTTKPGMQKAHQQIDAIIQANQKRLQERAEAKAASKPAPPTDYAEALVRAQERMRGAGCQEPEDNIAQQLCADGLMPGQQCRG